MKQSERWEQWDRSIIGRWAHLISDVYLSGVALGSVLVLSVACSKTASPLGADAAHTVPPPAQGPSAGNSSAELEVKRGSRAGISYQETALTAAALKEKLEREGVESGSVTLGTSAPDASEVPGESLRDPWVLVNLPNGDRKALPIPQPELAPMGSFEPSLVEFRADGTRVLELSMRWKSPAREAFDQALARSSGLLRGVGLAPSAVRCPREAKLVSVRSPSVPIRISLETSEQICPVDRWIPVRWVFSDLQWQGLMTAAAEGDPFEVEIPTPFGRSLLKRSVRWSVVPRLLREKAGLEFPRPSASPRPRVLLTRFQVESRLSEKLQALVREQGIPSTPLLLSETIARLRALSTEEVNPSGCGERAIEGGCLEWKLELPPRGNEGFELGVDELAIVGDEFLRHHRVHLNRLWGYQQPLVLKPALTSLSLTRKTEVIAEGHLPLTVRPGSYLEVSLNQILLPRWDLSQSTEEVIHQPGCRVHHQDCASGAWVCESTEVEPYNCRAECVNAVPVCARERRVCAEWEHVTPPRRGERASEMRSEPREPQGRVCMQWRNECEEWGSQCREQRTVCDQRSVCASANPPTLPSLPYRVGTQDPGNQGWFRWSCYSFSNSACRPEEQVDQWTKVTHYGAPYLIGGWQSSISRQALLEQELSAAERKTLLDSLRLQLSDGRELALESFERVYTKGKGWILKIPFDRQEQILGIRARAAVERKIPCGTLTERFDGSRVYSIPILPEEGNAEADAADDSFASATRMREWVTTVEADRRLGSQADLHCTIRLPFEVKGELRTFSSVFQIQKGMPHAR